MLINLIFIDRTRVHLIYDSQQESDGSRIFQTYELESTVEIAEQFRDQILNIIKLKNPQGRDIYEQQQQRRDTTKKRRSIFNLIGGGIGNSGSATKS
jgi:intergrase/recombinase